MNAPLHIPPPCDDKVQIVHVDDDFVVVNKPAGLLSIPGKYVRDSVLHRVFFQYPDVSVVHRLDLDTSGLMVLARSKLAAQALSRQFRERRVKKEYEAVVWGRMEPSCGKIDAPLAADPAHKPHHKVDFDGGKEAITWFETREILADASRLCLKPLTGRSHQLRVHMTWVGHPILGCDLYAHARAYAAADRLMLHACALSFAHPVTGEWQAFAAGWQ